MDIGLRVDVDTWRGTARGVPQLCRLLAAHGVKATFFFSAGPDNMGRHLWRLLRPAFFMKMLRSGAPSLYGWEIVLRGTLWPGPQIARGLGAVLAQTAQEGHEIGVHAWDHHAWQNQVQGASTEAIAKWQRQSYQAIMSAAGVAPSCAAAPAWRCTDNVLLAREQFNSHYNSDCRGTSIFVPLLEGGRALTQLQVPATLPTYDEVIGQGGITRANYNDYMLGQLRPDALNVLTVHAEAEGGICADLFADFVQRAIERGARFVPLGTLARAAQTAAAAEGGAPLPHCMVVPQVVAGREGWVSVQGDAAPATAGQAP